LQRIQAQLVEAPYLDLRPLLIRDVGERRTSPQVQPLTQHVDGACSPFLIQRAPAFVYSCF